MEVGEVGLMKYSMENIDERARKILGFDKDEVLEYDEVVDRYLLTLANYATNIDDKTFFKPCTSHNLNYSLYHLTGWIFSNYSRIITDEEVSKRMDENEHYNLLIKAASLVINRFVQNGMEDVANKEGATLYVIANAIYDYEKSLEDIDTKTLS